MRARRWTAGVDFGGTNIKVGLLSARGRIAASQILSTRRFGRPAAFLEGVSRTVESLSRAVGTSPARLAGVGVGAPGPVDAARGLVHACVNVPGWREVPLRRQFERRLRCRCVVENDANLVALGEWSFGAGARASHLVCLTLGTGVGGAILLSGEVYRGAAGSAGEIGHMVVNPRGRRCGCGNRGCLEAQISTEAIVTAARAAARRAGSKLPRYIEQAEGRITPLVVCEAARAGDRAARRIWVQVGAWLGAGVANVLNILNPDRVVIGGGVAEAWGLFAPTLRETVRARAMAVPARTARIVRARLGGRAGILGAAVLVWRATGQGHRPT